MQAIADIFFFKYSDRGFYRTYLGAKKRPLISESAREKGLFLPGVVFFVPGGVGADVVGVPETAVVGTVFGGVFAGGDFLA